MKKNKNINIFILDFNNDFELLSGNSLLCQLKFHNYELVNPIVIFNRDCFLKRKLDELKIRNKIVQYGRPGKINKLIDYFFLPIKFFYLYFRYKPKLIHANNVMSGRVAIIFKFIFKIPILIHLRNNKLPPRTIPFIKNADYFATVSESTMKEALPSYLYKKVKVVYDGINIQEFKNYKNQKINKSKIFNIPKKSIVIGMCSRLSQQKGIEDFIYAANIISRKYNNVFFVHAGGLPDKNSNDEFIRSLSSKKIKNIIWHGYIDNIKDFWINVDIAVVPSSDSEAFGRVILEAMLSRKPVIATKSGGPQEIITDGLNGILIDMKDKKNLVRSLIKLINSKDARSKISDAAYDMVTNRFNAELYSLRMENYYYDIIKNKKCNF